MIKVENMDVWGFEHAVRGMRNPMNSWDKSDSDYCENLKCSECRVYDKEGCHRPQYTKEKDNNDYIIGKNDLDLMKRLYKAGAEHRKYLRQIFVSMDITAPLYWWKEFDTYKVGTVANSCSTMHKIASKKFEESDFSIEHLFTNTESKISSYGEWVSCNPHARFQCIINDLNFCRDKYLETKDKNWWWQLIQLLPTSYNQKRTITMNYENVITIIKQRTGHKLDEWNEFVAILKDLPYVEEIMGYGNKA